jgi:hypothetical protein
MQSSLTSLYSDLIWCNQIYVIGCFSPLTIWGWFLLRDVCSSKSSRYTGCKILGSMYWSWVVANCGPLLLIWFLALRWVLGNTLVELGIKPSHQLHWLLNYKTLENLVNQVLNLEHIPMEHLAFYTWWKTHMKSSRSCMEHWSRAPYFLYMMMCMLKVIVAKRYVDREHLAFYTRQHACWK